MSLLLALILCLPARAGVVTLRPAEAAKLRRLVKEDPSARARWAEVRREAKRGLDEAPAPVAELLTAGELQGSPAKTRTQAAIKDFDKARALALVAAVDGDEAALERAKSYLLAWAAVNKPVGRPIDETTLEPMIEAYDLVRDGCSAEQKSAVDDWLVSVATAELVQADVFRKTKPGTSVNNWHSHRLKTIGLIAWSVDEPKLMDYAAPAFEAQLGANLKRDGSSLDFHERDAVSYHAYDLVALLRLQMTLARDGRSKYGGRLREAVAFLVPYATGEKTHAEFVGSKVAFDLARSKNKEKGHVIGEPFDPKRAVPALALAQYFEPDLRQLVAKLSGKPGERYPTLRVLLNEATR